MKPTISVTFGAQEEPRYVNHPVLWGWSHIPHPNPSVMEIHLMPMSDCGTHAFDMQCPCSPVEDQIAPGFFHHCAFDGREAYETGARKPH